MYRMLLTLLKVWCEGREGEGKHRVRGGECCGAAEEAITNNGEATNWSWELKVLTSLEGVKEPASEGKAAPRGDSRLAAST